MVTSKRKEGAFLRLNEKWSVGFIANPPQWTLCRRRTLHGVVEWHPVSWCQTRDALLRAVREKVIRGAEFYAGSENMPVDGAVMAQIANFPDRADR